MNQTWPEVAKRSSMRFRGCRSSSLERFGDDKGRGSDFLAGGSNYQASGAVWRGKKVAGPWRSWQGGRGATLNFASPSIYM